MLMQQHIKVFYTAQMMRLTAQFARVPTPGTEPNKLRVLFTRRLARRCRSMGEGALLDDWERTCRVTPTQLRRTPGQWVVAVRGGLLDDFNAIGVAPTAADAWSFSLWRGYLDQPQGRRLADWFDAAGAKATHLHTSGHATPADLRAFASAIDAKQVVPIHGERWDEPQHALPNQVRVGDGVPWPL